MRFALLGDHEDGRAFAAALTATGRHEVVSGATPDIEEILADPTIDACIVAVPVSQRLDVSRRVLQSERHAAVVHPVDVKPDGAYELNMLQGDTHHVVMPLLVQGFGSQIDEARSQSSGAPFLDIEFSHPVDPLLAIDDARRHPVFPGWQQLRTLGGEIAEVSAFGREEEVVEGEPVFVSGRFATGRLFRTSYIKSTGSRRTTIRIRDDKVEVVVAQQDWRHVVEEFERAVTYLAASPKAAPAAGAEDRPAARLSWQDEIRCAELDDSVARSLNKRRAMLLDYQEASEEVGFKGTMTLVGCGMLWFLLVVLIAAMIYPPLFWVSVPILFGFLALQLLRWAIPKG